jgi:hypothetical protein
LKSFCRSGQKITKGTEGLPNHQTVPDPLLKF